MTAKDAPGPHVRMHVRMHLAALPFWRAYLPGAAVALPLGLALGYTVSFATVGHEPPIAPVAMKTAPPAPKAAQAPWPIAPAVIERIAETPPPPISFPPPRELRGEIVIVRAGRVEAMGPATMILPAQSTPRGVFHCQGKPGGSLDCTAD